MRSWCVVVGLLLSAPAFAEIPPQTFEGALAQAQAADKPLVIELTAPWCGPCRYFEQKVLTLADVQAELEHVSFVRYDFESEPGASIAKRFDVNGVPSFLVFDRKGELKHRYEGLGGIRGEEWVWFVSVLRTAVSGRQDQFERVLELKIDVAARPDNADARMRLARALRALRKTDEAAEQYTWVVDHVTDQAAAGLAMAERDEMLRGRERVQQALASAAELVRWYPASEAASFRIALLGVSRDPPSDLPNLVRAHLDQVPLKHWPAAVRAAIVAGELDAARASVFDRGDPAHNDALTRLVLAEVSIAAGDPRLALETLGRTCQGKDHALWCYVLEQTILAGGREPPTISRLRTRAFAYLTGLEEPEHGVEPGHGIEGLLDAAPELGDAIALSLRAAQHDCAAKAQRGGSMFVAIDLAPGGRPHSVRVQSAEGGALDRCVERALGKRELPAVPEGVDPHVHALLVFNRSTPEAPWQLSRANSIVAGAAARFGDVQTYGFASRFAFGLGRYFMGGGQLELAAGDTGKPAYAARALVGLHGRLWWLPAEGMVLFGGGVSDLGKMSPRQFETAIETRLIIPVRVARIHLWQDVGNALGWGAGVSFPVGDVRIMFAGEYEQRAVGNSTVFSIGWPVGELY